MLLVPNRVYFFYCSTTCSHWEKTNKQKCHCLFKKLSGFVLISRLFNFCILVVWHPELRCFVCTHTHKHTHVHKQVLFTLLISHFVTLFINSLPFPVALLLLLARPLPWTLHMQWNTHTGISRAARYWKHPSHVATFLSREWRPGVSSSHWTSESHLLAFSLQSEAVKSSSPGDSRTPADHCERSLTVNMCLSPVRMWPISTDTHTRTNTHTSLESSAEQKWAHN